MSFDAAVPPPPPLDGVRVLEVGGIGPAPFAGMHLAEMGADVVRVDRPGAAPVLPMAPSDDLLNRGKRSIVLDLKDDADRATLLDLAATADVLLEGFRPGVAERLGFGPDACWQRNPRLVFGRMTGWGQDGPLAATAGHDLNYIGLTGALHAIGPADGPPQIPINLVGDFGGGALYLVAGVLASLVAVQRGAERQVVDAAIVDGVVHLLASVHSLRNAGAWTDERGANLLDGGAPFYAVYATADGGHMAVAAIEPQFYAALVRTLELPLDPAAQHDRAGWPEVRDLLAATFRGRTRSHWTERFAGIDACVSPVLTLGEAADDPQLRARHAIRRDGGRMEPAPAPRFGTAPPPSAARPPRVGEDTAAVLAGWLGR